MKRRLISLKREPKKIPKEEIAAKEAPAKKPRKKEVKTAAVASIYGMHNLQVPKGAHKPKKLLGRGSSSGHGKTSTRGSKGQTSRAGRHFYLGFEGGQSPLIRRIPKRGFTSIFKKKFQIVNLRDLDRIKETTITLELMEQGGLIKDKAGLVKVLGDGEIKKAINIQAHAFSKKASDAIKNAGGKIEIVHLNV